MRKNFLSLFFVFVLIITATLPVSETNTQAVTEEGQEEEVIVLTEAEPLKLDVPDGFVECQFVPKETGLYRIYSTDASVDPRGYLYDATGTNRIGGDTDSAEDGYNFVFDCGLVAGETYNLWIYSKGDHTNCTIHAEHLELPSIEIGTPIAIKAENWEHYQYQFVPEETAFYDIYTYADYHSSSEIKLYDAGYQLIETDSYGDDSDVRITYELEAGKTYYIETYDYNGRGSYTLQIDYTILFEDIAKDAIELSFTDEKINSLDVDVENSYDNVADSLIKLEFPKRGYYKITVTEADANKISLRDMTLYNRVGENLSTDPGYGSWSMEGTYDAAVHYIGLDNGTKDSVTYTITVEALPVITDVIVEPVSGATTSGGFVSGGAVYVTYGRGGYWSNTDGERTYEFYSDTIRNLLKITLVYDDGKTETMSDYNFARCSYFTNQSSEHIWLPSGSDYSFIVKADDVQKEIPVTVVALPTPESIELELINPYATLIEGRDGYMSEHYDENNQKIETYVYYEQNAFSLYKVTFTYEDGTSESCSLTEFAEKNGLIWETGQSQKTPWVPHGENNTLYFTIDGVELTVNVPVMEWSEFKDSVYEVTGDTIIDLSDAQLVLRYALGIEAAEYNYTLADAQTCLLIALGIPV